jgi:hypothetical protein
MLRIPIRSRLGNAALGILGALYFVSAGATLIYYVATNWGASGTLDHVLQLALFGSALAGLFFIKVAADNLGIDLRHPRRSIEKSRSSRDRQTTPATEP